MVLLKQVMVIEIGKGNLLTAQVEALVNPVNTEGVMGKGLALQFKRAFPDNFVEYERACAVGAVRVGKVHVVERLASPRYIINFPTKQKWRLPSRIEYIEEGLKDLVATVRNLHVRSIAIPPLGCGNGGLEWTDVKPRIEAAFAALDDVRVLLFSPAATPHPDHMLENREKPRMTTPRAALIGMLDQYLATGYDYKLTLLEVQKLAYFLQLAGFPLRLDFRPLHYGPYADNLRKALRNIEGHYTSGLGDGTSNKPDVPIKLLENAAAEANDFLARDAAASTRIQRVKDLIHGFETPFGMELLASVHWVMTQPGANRDLASVINAVHAWSDRKKAKFKPGHIEAAFNRLRQQQWA